MRQIVYLEQSLETQESYFKRSDRKNELDCYIFGF